MSIDATSSFNNHSQFQQRIDPDAFAQQYVNQGKASSLDEAKESLRSKYGDPIQDDSQDSGASSNCNRIPEDWKLPSLYGNGEKPCGWGVGGPQGGPGINIFNGSSSSDKFEEIRQRNPYLYM